MLVATMTMTSRDKTRLRSEETVALQKPPSLKLSSFLPLLPFCYTVPLETSLTLST